MDSTFVQGQQHGLLTAKQEQNLALQIQLWQQWPDGADSAPEHIQRLGLRCRDLLVSHNRRLVLSILRKYNIRSFDRDLEVSDLYQYGLIGLTTAAEKFDPTRGVRFSTIAVFWIRQSVNRGLHTHRGLIKVPVHLSEKITKVKRFISSYTAQNKKSPTLEEIAEGTEFKPDLVSKILNVHNLQQHSSVEAVGPTNNNISREDLDHFLDVYQPNNDSVFLGTQDQDNTIDSIIEEERSNAVIKKVKYLLKYLSAEQKFIVIHYFGLFNEEPCKLQQIVPMINNKFDTNSYTLSKVKSLYTSAMRKMDASAKSLTFGELAC